ncbi:hypothetical protein DFH11DRAFT_1579502 [Phellopilus nigrolimitatus]|nr:hypothetical protein DFH11DRAFT_1579502 [Phellopilus nigrolimitatus]
MCVARGGERWAVSVSTGTNECQHNRLHNPETTKRSAERKRTGDGRTGDGETTREGNNNVCTCTYVRQSPRQRQRTVHPSKVQSSESTSREGKRETESGRGNRAAWGAAERARSGRIGIYCLFRLSRGGGGRRRAAAGCEERARYVLERVARELAQVADGGLRDCAAAALHACGGGRGEPGEEVVDGVGGRERHCCRVCEGGRV